MGAFLDVVESGFNFCFDSFVLYLTDKGYWTMYHYRVPLTPCNVIDSGECEWWVWDE